MSKSTFRNYSKTYFFNACFDKNQLKNLITWFIKQSGEKITVDFLETLKQIGFHQATLAGVSLGLDDLQIPSQKPLLISQAKSDVSSFDQQSRSGNLTSVEKSQGMISTWNQTSEILRKTAVQQFKNTNPVNPVYMMAFSGARGNISQVRQLVAMRGLMADPQGVILEFPIQSNFREGLTVTEYLISCFGARKGLVDTALRTATSGYLTRRLVDAAQHVIVTVKDCGTTQGFRLRNKELEQHLIGRVLAKDISINSTFLLKRNKIVSLTLAKLISKHFKQVFVRSPLTCQAENSICQLCYGWNLAHGNLVSIGEAVGVIAAQSIGEPGTQLTMRTFHTGGVGVFSDQAMKYFIAPYDGIIDYTSGLAGHFVRTPHGKIVYMLKTSTTSTQNIIFKLKSFETKHVQYFIKKEDLPPGSILLVRQGEHVKSGQILAQSSQIKKSKQKMPESTHPVFSPIDGEVYLESMTILKYKQLSPTTKKRKKIQKKEKEIGPDIRTLKGLGNFWVFSSQNQKESYVAKTLMRPGDLVSSKSSLFQYDFFITNRYIFHTILNKSCLGVNTVSLPLENINFHRIAYSMVIQNSSILNKNKDNNQKNVLFFNKKRLQNFLIWFPHTSLLANYGYFFNFLLYSDIKTKSTINSSNFLTKGKKSIDHKSVHEYTSTQLKGSFFYFPQKIQKWRIPSSLKNYFFKETHRFVTKKSITFYLNLNTQENLKNNLLVQYHPELINFSKKFLLSTNKSVSENGRKIKRKFFYCTQKNYLIKSSRYNDSIFLNLALNRVKSLISLKGDFSSIFVQEKSGWVYLPSLKKPIKKSKLGAKTFVLEQGKILDNLMFLNSKICIKSISNNKIRVLKNNIKSCQNYQTQWYYKESFLTQKSFLNLEDRKNQQNYVLFQPLNSFTKIKEISEQKYSCKSWKKKSKCFLYYKLKNFVNTNLGNRQINRPLLIKEKNVHRNRTNSLFIISSLNEFSLPKKDDLNRNWHGIKSFDKNYLTNSPLFIKQESTTFQKNTKLRKKFQLLVTASKGWLASKNIFKVLINLNSPVLYKKVNQNCVLSTYIKQHKIPLIGLNIFLYNSISLPENISFCFYLFENKWVIPKTKITTGFIKIRKTGEFRRFNAKKNTSITCLLTTQDLVRLDFSKFSKYANHAKNVNKTKQLKIGCIIRSITEIYPGTISSRGGIIVNKNFNQFTIRLGLPFLSSSRGIIHIFQNDLIQKNDLLVTLKSRRLQTEDIVQGIPKIEQLFEARQTQGGTIIRNSVHTRLKKYFLSSLKSEKNSTQTIHTTLSNAITDSLNKIQFFLVQSILQAYSSQGVKISQKHIEIIVRQMTTRVRILAGGDTGLLAGELIQFTKIKKVNHQLGLLGKRPAIYEPLILGITKSVLQSESFLLSASFQEVSRVLVRSALTKKTDFLRGLHENVILGQLVPTGTGLVSVSTKTKSH